MISPYAITFKEWCELFYYIPDKEKEFAGRGVKLFYNMLSASDIPNNIYYTRKSVPTEIVGTDLAYEELAPFSNCMMMTPKQYLFSTTKPTNLWKASKIDDYAIERILSMNSNKYSIIEKSTNIPDHPYILFIISSILLQEQTIKRVLQWAHDNQQYVIFKDHPYPLNGVRAKTYWNKYGALLSKYVTLIDTGNLETLLEHCTAVWCYNSGVGFKAILKKKPVAYFLAGELSNLVGGICVSPEQAAQATVPTEEDTYRYISWLYNKVLIDTELPNAGEILEKRLHSFYIQNKRTITEFLL